MPHLQLLKPMLYAVSSLDNQARNASCWKHETRNLWYCKRFSMVSTYDLGERRHCKSSVSKYAKARTKMLLIKTIIASSLTFCSSHHICPTRYLFCFPNHSSDFRAEWFGHIIVQLANVNFLWYFGIEGFLSHMLRCHSCREVAKYANAQTCSSYVAVMPKFFDGNCFAIHISWE